MNDLGVRTDHPMIAGFGTFDVAALSESRGFRLGSKWSKGYDSIEQ